MLEGYDRRHSQRSHGERWMLAIRLRLRVILNKPLGLNHQSVAGESSSIQTRGTGRKEHPG